MRRINFDRLLPRTNKHHKNCQKKTKWQKCTRTKQTKQKQFQQFRLKVLTKRIVDNKTAEHAGDGNIKRNLVVEQLKAELKPGTSKRNAFWRSDKVVVVKWRQR